MRAMMVELLKQMHLQKDVAVERAAKETVVREKRRSARKRRRMSEDKRKQANVG